MQAGSLHPVVVRLFTATWRFVTTRKLGLACVVVLVYVVPYGLAAAAITTLARSAGGQPVVILAALAITSFVAAQPAPTPGMGTLSLAFAAAYGAFDSLLIAGLVGAGAQTLGLTVSYGAGAAGLGPAIASRLSSKTPAATKTIERAGDLIQRHGAAGMFVLAFVPNPLYTYSSVLSGAAGSPFKRFLVAVAGGGLARFFVAAALGAGIERLVDRE